MAHHGRDPFDDGEGASPSQFKKLFENPMREVMKREHLLETVGPTGDFPEGKLTEHDEGGIMFAVGVRKGKVVIDFGTPTAWVGMTADQAIELGNLLFQRARQLGAAVTVRISHDES